MSERILWRPWTAVTRRSQVSATPEFITTFRKGPKWLRPELVGQRVELFDEGTQTVFATAEVISVKYVAFKDISGEDYSWQSNARNEVDMLEVMRSVYNNEYDRETGTAVVTLGRIEVV